MIHVIASSTLNYTAIVYKTIIYVFINNFFLSIPKDLKTSPNPFSVRPLEVIIYNLLLSKLRLFVYYLVEINLLANIIQLTFL